ncbi:putative toxin-antitoxin system toxin component, PIN family [Limnohabitans sp.]|uniref:putative toxin-antitoxin system toxin component, PIN family n=1 Tax=Limnohabitans sp. TaxID=1907725 RepID=UPI0037BF2A65
MKVFLDTNVWLSATVFAGLCEAILTESAQRAWLVTTRLVQQEAHEVLGRKFAHLPQAQVLFDAVWAEAACVPDVDEPADDNDARLVQAALNAGAAVFVTGDRRVLGWGARGSMQILSPRDAWMQLFAQSRMD